MPPINITINNVERRKQAVLPFDRDPAIVTYGIGGSGNISPIVKMHESEKSKLKKLEKPDDAKKNASSIGGRNPVNFSNRPLLSSVNFGLLFGSVGLLECVCGQPIRGAYSVLAGSTLYAFGRITETKQRDQEQMSFINLYSEY
jgi:hypothetical protein